MTIASNPGLTPEVARRNEQVDGRDRLGAGAGVFPSSFVDLSDVTITGGTAKLTQGTTQFKYRVGGTLSGLPNITPVGNVGTGEDDLMTYTIRGGTFATDGDEIALQGVFTVADAATIKAYFNGSLITNSSIATDETAPVCIFALQIIRLSSSSVLISGAGLTAFFGGAVTGLTLTSDIVFKFTGEAVTTNDIIQKALIGHYWPAN